MNWDGIALATLVGGLLCLGADGQEKQAGKGPALAGWLGVFPELQGYQRTFTAPVVEKKDAAYRQTAKYEWTGGAVRLVEVTLARDPAFKERYAEEALKKDPGAPEQVKVGERIGWLWKVAKEGDKDPWPLQARLVVPLGGDPWGEGLAALARRFDLKKIEKALDAAPRTDFRRRLESFRELKKGMSYAEVTTWVGHADADIGSGIHIMEYRLGDGSRVLLGFPDFNRLIYVKHARGGETQDLVK
jgi:hypothetical protein